MIVVGIDPGITGALAILDTETRLVKFVDTPTVTVKSGKKFKNQMDPRAIVEILSVFTEDTFITIEKVNAMPNFRPDPENPGAPVRNSMGVTSAFNFGMGFGMWLGILAAMKLPYQTVHPITWKRSMMADMGKEKDASRVKAIQLFPNVYQDLKLKKHHGRADALLIATWGAKNFHTPVAPLEEELSLF